MILLKRTIDKFPVKLKRRRGTHLLPPMVVAAVVVFDCSLIVVACLADWESNFFQFWKAI